MFFYSNLVYFFFIIYVQYYSKLFYIKYYKIIHALHRKLTSNNKSQPKKTIHEIVILAQQNWLNLKKQFLETQPSDTAFS